MKRLFSALLALSLLFCLCACDQLQGLLNKNQSEATSPATNDIESPETPDEPHKQNPNYTPIVGEEPSPEDHPDDGVITPAPNPQPTPDPETEPEAEPETEPETEPEPEPEPETEPETQTPTRPEKIEVTAAQLQQIEDEFLVLINQERVRVGLNTITINDALDGFAQIRAEEIITRFAHDRPDDRSWDTVLNRSEYPYVTAGENIVMTPHVGDQKYNPNKDYWTGSPEQISAAAAWAFKLFRGSPAHYENITNGAFKETGIGLTYVMDETGTIPIFYLAHLFGAQ